MPFVLTTKGQVACPHGAVAPVSSLRGSAKYQIDSANVMCETNIGSVPFPCSAKPPCTAITKWIANQLKFKVDGSCILTDSSILMTNNGPGKVILAGQLKLSLSG